MQDIEEYIKKSKKERQAHLRLEDPCVERGGGRKNGSSTSSMCRGLMAHMFDTTIPTGWKIYVCHACHNNKCSNPNHLYWGTSSENTYDAIANGRKSIWEILVTKYGLEKASEIQRTKSHKRWARGVKA